MSFRNRGVGFWLFFVVAEKFALKSLKLRVSDFFE